MEKQKLAHLNHNINNSVMVIIGMVDALIRKDLTKEEQLKILDVIKTRALSCSSALEDINKGVNLPDYI